MSNSTKIKERLLLLGDIHGELSVIYDYIERLDLTHVTILQVGDFGYGFDKPALILLDDFLKNKNINLIINRGNHDNYYNHFPNLIKLKFVKKLSNIIFLKDFDILGWGDKRILCIGGATSIDRIDRVVDESYWVQESINYDKINFNSEENTFQRFMYDAHTKNIDVVISHTAPLSFHLYLKLSSLEYRYKNDPTLKQDLEREHNFLDNMLNVIQPKQWICGHFHQSVMLDALDTKCGVLGINELYEVRLE